MKQQELINLSKKISGSLIFIGSENKQLLDSLSKNKNITKIDVLSSITTKKSKGKGENKIVSIYSFRNIFKKKKTDTLIYDYEMIVPYLKRFVRDSIYTIKNDIYIYNVKNEDALIKKYKRYNVTVNNGEILHISCKKAKNNFFKDTYYFIIDTFNNAFDLISDFLVQ
jgi:hypothetical protein